MLIKTSELSGAALDWAAAKALGLVATGERVVNGPILVSDSADDLQREFAPSTDWAQGGPLIESYQVALVPEANDGRIGTESSDRWIAEIYYDGGEHYITYACDTALIAACRAIVAAKLGDEVEVPDDLLSAPL